MAGCGPARKQKPCCITILTIRDRTILAIGVAEDDPARQHARREEMAENLRLFYVALTRAKQRCYLVWGKIKEAETAPPAWLLHRPTVKESGKDWLQATQERFRKMEGVAIRNELQTVFAAAGETVAIAPLPQESGQRYQPPTVVEPELKARIFGGSLLESWRIGSFTALTAGHAIETPDYDMAAAVPARPKPNPPLRFPLAISSLFRVGREQEPACMRFSNGWISPSATGYGWKIW